MSAGRGFICLAAILIARGKPFQTTLVAVLFGFFSALAIQLQSFNIPTHFLQMIPYAVAIVTLAVMEMSGRKRSLIT
jgi:simple sugar transport system permease protein